MTELKLRGYNKYYDGGVEEIVVGSKRRVHKARVHKARGIKRVKEANLFDRPPSRIKIRLNQIVIFLQNKTIFLNPS